MAEANLTKRMTIRYYELGNADAAAVVRVPLDFVTYADTVMPTLTPPLTVDGWTCTRVSTADRTIYGDGFVVHFNFSKRRGRKTPSETILLAVVAAAMPDVLALIAARDATWVAAAQARKAQCLEYQREAVYQHLVNAVAKAATKRAKARLNYDARLAALRIELNEAVRDEAMMMEQLYYDNDCDTPKKGWAAHFAEYKHTDTFRVQQGQFSEEEFEKAVKEAKVRAASDLRAGTFKATSMGTLTLHAPDCTMED